MSQPARKWDDLQSRIATAVLMAIVGFGAVYMGRPVLNIAVAVLIAVMIWELVRMLAPAQNSALIGLPLIAGISGICAIGFDLIPPYAAVAIVVLIGAIWLPKGRLIFAAYSALIMTGALGILYLRQDFGLATVFWLIAVVVVTDIAGYFAGRILGGPKFWPRVSPKKTWSGTAAGWVGAALIGILIAVFGIGPSNFILFSVLVAFASQLGDIAESAIKRHSGIKDSSNLLPGHGGFLDRFDGMIAAASVAAILFAFSSAA